MVLFGLGNPGEQFAGTRHNVGADMVLAWIEHMRSQGASVSEWKEERTLHVRSCQVSAEGQRVMGISSLLYMNDSGKALMEYTRYYGIAAGDVLVVHDELELPFGEIKIQTGGSAKGHNGVRSIHEYMSDGEITRLKIGIDRPQDETPVEKFVLSKFTEEEREVLERKKQEILEAISEFVFPSP